MKKQIYFIAFVVILHVPFPICWAGEPRDPFLVLFEPVEARFVRLTILGINEGNGAAIDELEAFAPGKTENLVAAEKGVKATASSALDDPRHAVSYLNDGRYGERFLLDRRDRRDGVGTN